MMPLLYPLIVPFYNHENSLHAKIGLGGGCWGDGRSSKACERNACRNNGPLLPVCPETSLGESLRSTLNAGPSIHGVCQQTSNPARYPRQSLWALADS